MSLIAVQSTGESIQNAPHIQPPLRLIGVGYRALRCVSHSQVVGGWGLRNRSPEESVTAAGSLVVLLKC